MAHITNEEGYQNLKKKKYWSLDLISFKNSVHILKNCIIINWAFSMSSFDFSSPVIRDRTQESGMQLCQGRFALDNRKMFITQRVVGTGTDSTGTGHSTESGRVQEGFRQCSQAHGVVLGVSCAGAGVGLQCPCRLSVILKSIFNAIFMAIPVCVFVFLCLKESGKISSLSSILFLSVLHT